MDCISDKIPLLIQEYNDSMKSPVFNGLSQSKDNQLKKAYKIRFQFQMSSYPLVPNLPQQSCWSISGVYWEWIVNFLFESHAQIV